MAMTGIWVEDTITQLTQSCFVSPSQSKQSVLCPVTDITYRSALILNPVCFLTAFCDVMCSCYVIPWVCMHQCLRLQN